MEEIIEDGEFLYRGVVENCWNFAENRPSSAAFKDSKGVSVDRDGGRNKDECVSALLAKRDFFAVCRLTAGDARECDTVVKYRPIDDNEYHSEIHDSETQAEIKSKSKSRKLTLKSAVVHGK